LIGFFSRATPFSMVTPNGTFWPRLVIPPLVVWEARPAGSALDKGPVTEPTMSYP
jgi:hypothetical protein